MRRCSTFANDWQDVEELLELEQWLVRQNFGKAARPAGFLATGIRGGERSFEADAFHLSGAEVYFDGVEDVDVCSASSAHTELS